MGNGRKKNKRPPGKRSNVDNPNRAGLVPRYAGLSKPLPGLEERHRVVMPYAVTINLAPAAGVTTYYSFRGNSVFDPDFSGTGTTALTYSTWSTLYNRYRALGSRIQINAINVGTTAIQLWLEATISNAPPVTSVYTVGQRHVATGITAPGGPAVWQHRASAWTSLIFGVPEAQVRDEDDFAGLVGANPNNVWYWHLVVYNPGGAAGAVNVTVRMDIDTIWSMPLKMGV